VLDPWLSLLQCGLVLKEGRLRAAQDCLGAVLTVDDRRWVMATAAERRSFSVGEEASLVRVVTDAAIRAYAELSGDDNPIHVDEEYAQHTAFGGRVAHGLLVASLISALLGTKLPGPGAIYLSQYLKFTAPVRPGDTVTARVRVTSWDPVKGRLTMATEVANQHGTQVIAGEAQLVMSAYLRSA